MKSTWHLAQWDVHFRRGTWKLRANEGNEIHSPHLMLTLGHIVIERNGGKNCPYIFKLLFFSIFFFDKYIKLNVCKLIEHVSYLLTLLVNNIDFLWVYHTCRSLRRGFYGSRVWSIYFWWAGRTHELIHSSEKSDWVSSMCQMLSQVLRKQR